MCIADEVQTGFGRTGTNYWGFQNQGVVPDIVTMAKVRALRADVAVRCIRSCGPGTTAVISMKPCPALPRPAPALAAEHLLGRQQSACAQQLMSIQGESMPHSLCWAGDYFQAR